MWIAHLVCTCLLGAALASGADAPAKDAKPAAGGTPNANPQGGAPFVPFQGFGGGFGGFPGFNNPFMSPMSAGLVNGPPMGGMGGMGGMAGPMAMAPSMMGPAFGGFGGGFDGALAPMASMQDGMPSALFGGPTFDEGYGQPMGGPMPRGPRRGPRGPGRGPRGYSDGPGPRSYDGPSRHYDDGPRRGYDSYGPPSRYHGEESRENRYSRNYEQRMPTWTRNGERYSTRPDAFNSHPGMGPRQPAENFHESYDGYDGGESSEPAPVQPFRPPPSTHRERDGRPGPIHKFNTDETFVEGYEWKGRPYERDGPNGGRDAPRDVPPPPRDDEPIDDGHRRPRDGPRGDYDDRDRDY